MRLPYWFRKYSPDWLDNILMGICNLINYGPLIWKTREWDYGYLVGFMSFKMRRMADYMDNFGWLVDAKKNATSLRRTAYILDRMEDPDQHSRSLYTAHFKKWYRSDSGNLIKSLTEDHLSDEERVKCNKEFEDLLAHEEYMLKQDEELFCKYWKKYYRSWWD